jgi:hypothetical protein
MRTEKRNYLNEQYVKSCVGKTYTGDKTPLLHYASRKKLQQCKYDLYRGETDPFLHNTIMFTKHFVNYTA